MALYKYLKPKTNLPVCDPYGPLSRRIHPSAIAEVNKQVEATQNTKKKRGEYCKKYSNTDKAVVAKYACENGIAATIKHFASKQMDLKESTVRDWRKLYRISGFFRGNYISRMSSKTVFVIFIFANSRLSKYIPRV